MTRSPQDIETDAVLQVYDHGELTGVTGGEAGPRNAGGPVDRTLAETLVFKKYLTWTGTGYGLTTFGRRQAQMLADCREARLQRAQA